MVPGMCCRFTLPLNKASGDEKSQQNHAISNGYHIKALIKDFLIRWKFGDALFVQI